MDATVEAEAGEIVLSLPPVEETISVVYPIVSAVVSYAFDVMTNGKAARAPGLDIFSYRAALEDRAALSIGSSS